MGIDTALQHGVMSFINHQREQLRSTGEVQRRYLSYLSHDLRNNLNGCTLMLEVLRQRLEGLAGFEDDVEDIASVQRSVAETIAGMDRILQAEAPAPRGDPAARPGGGPERIAHDVARQAGRQAAHKGLHLRVEVPDGATVDSDRELITLVLQNLIGNAVKYSAKGTVTVSAAPRGPDARRLGNHRVRRGARDPAPPPRPAVRSLRGAARRTGSRESAWDWPSRIRRRGFSAGD